VGIVVHLFLATGLRQTNTVLHEQRYALCLEATPLFLLARAACLTACLERSSTIIFGTEVNGWIA
jgi:hypothetical protein